MLGVVTMTTLEDRLQRSFDRLERSLARQFATLVCIQLVILVTSVAAILLRP
jgi:hypothetical protein